MLNLPGEFKYRLLPREKPEQGIARVIREQMDWASSCCLQPAAEAGKAVHELRKAMKRIRAALRLLRYTMGEERFQLENARFRETGNLLADLRKSYVMPETLDYLLSRRGASSSVPAGVECMQYLEALKASLSMSLHEGPDPFEICRLRLDEAGKQFLLNGQIPADIPGMTAGLKKTYRSGYKKFSIAYRAPSMENNHNFRKAAKNLWHQMQLLRISWPAALGPFISSLDRLCNRLGMEHDLAELERAITGHTIINEKEKEFLFTLLRRQRKRIQHSAWTLAAKIYAEKPSAFARRMETYLILMTQKNG